MALMGFPASSGAPFIDYMFVDAVVAPRGHLGEHEHGGSGGDGDGDGAMKLSGLLACSTYPLQQKQQWAQQQQQQQQQQQELQGQEELQGQQELKGHQQFSEALVRLPHSYFANAYRALYANTPASPEDFDNPAPGGLPIGSGDTATGTAADAMRLSLGLPCRPAVVYCCCNQLYKLDPATLGVWCRVLARVPGSVLWLLRFPADAERRVRDAAEAAGAPPAALVFTDVDRKVGGRSVGVGVWGCGRRREGGERGGGGGARCIVLLLLKKGVGELCRFSLTPRPLRDTHLSHKP
eukprot:357277-Chlamydomonas_euryale.AAC.3